MAWRATVSQPGGLFSGPPLLSASVNALLFIPWFKLETWHIPLPFAIPTPFGGSLHDIPIQPFGILVAIAVLFGVRMAEKRAESLGLSPVVISDFVMHVVITAFIVCYFMNALLYEPEKLWKIIKDPRELFHEYLGLSSFGGFTGAVLGLFIWKWRRKMKIMPAADVTCYAFPFGWIFGRMGCFVVHDHPGRVTDFFLAVANYQTPDAVPPFPARHDLGFYEVLWSISAATVMWWLGKRDVEARKRRDAGDMTGPEPRKWGFYYALLPMMYAPVRFGLDFLRATDKEGGDVRYYGLTPGHYYSILLFVGGAALMWYTQTHAGSEVPEGMKIEGDNPTPSKPASMPPSSSKRKKR